MKNLPTTPTFDEINSSLMDILYPKKEEETKKEINNLLAELIFR